MIANVGATGSVGRHVVEALRPGHAVRALVSQPRQGTWFAGAGAVRGR